MEKADFGVRDRIVAFLRDLRERTGCRGFTIGLSGGIDSAVVTKLAADAVGGENVSNIFMPVDSTPAADHECTERMSRLWKTSFRTINIQKPLDDIVSLTGSTERIDIGNIAARIRMNILFNDARRKGNLVLGTSNRSELMMGYFTKFGDGACDAMPICGLYKTQVRQLAALIGVPDDIISKPPSAGLWEGQTDENDMEITYEHLDIILDALDRGADPKDVVCESISLEDIQRISARVSAMSHKVLPPYRP